MTDRIEHDTMGEVRVPADRLWGAQTQRALENFRIGTERMPLRLIRAYALLKKACAEANRRFGLLDGEIAGAIGRACDEIIAGHHDREFPLPVWQTGSGTQTNMNLNEVIAHRAAQILADSGRAAAVHPNDQVNLSQSTNDTFPTAMHVAALLEVEDNLLPALTVLATTLADRAERFAGLVKIGRTHLQDAVPLTLGQEIGGWAAMLDGNRLQIRQAGEQLLELAIGGTAVGTGLNAPPGFGEAVAGLLAEMTGKPFFATANPFRGLTAHDQLVFASGALKALAANLLKIAGDVRLLASGPRCGLGEITLPANEPGSSIMPGKINPTQTESLSMVACQVIGNDATITLGASGGILELNTYKPLIIHNFLQSAGLLADALRSFAAHCAAGIEPVPERIDRHLRHSLMLVTALNPHIGYEYAARIAQAAYRQNITLREAAVQSGLVTAEQFDQWVVPEKMVRPKTP